MKTSEERAIIAFESKKWDRLMKGITILGIIATFIMTLPAIGQIKSADERIRREKSNNRQGLTLKEVKANKISLKGKTFLLRLYINASHDTEQIESNRYRLWIEDSPGDGGTQLIDLPRNGVSALGKAIQPGDLVIARLKAGETRLILECLGVSSVNVWK